MTTDPTSRPSGEAIPRRLLKSYLLLALRRAHTSYGYVLFEQVKAYGLAADLAAVYRALRNMDRADLVETSWVSSAQGPNRRLYSLTADGERAAALAAGELLELRRALDVAIESFGLAEIASPAS